MSKTTALRRPRPPPLPRVPPEVWEHVIDIYAEERDQLANSGDSRYEWQSDLLPLALVCRTWVFRTRLHLFTSVILSSPQRIEKFLKTLVRSPEHGKLVKTLEIEGPWVEASMEENVQSCRWIHEALFTLPPLVPRVRTLILHWLPVLHPSYLVLFSRFKSVRSLALDFLDRQSASEVIQLVNRFPKLHQLTLGISYGTRRPMRCLFKMKQDLTCLYFKPRIFPQGSNEFLQYRDGFSYNLPFPEIIRILEGCSQSLRELYLLIPEGLNWRK